VNCVIVSSLIKDDAIMVARRYWHLGRLSGDVCRNASSCLSGLASIRAAIGNARPACWQVADRIVSAEYVKARAPFDRGASNQRAALARSVNSTGRRTSR
jgi:hypothetical protein